MIIGHYATGRAHGGFGRKVVRLRVAERPHRTKPFLELESVQTPESNVVRPID